MKMISEFESDFWPCLNCGKILRAVQERKKHDLAFHYDYVLTQCNGNREILKEWAKHD